MKSIIPANTMRDTLSYIVPADRLALIANVFTILGDLQNNITEPHLCDSRLGFFAVTLLAYPETSTDEMVCDSLPGGGENTFVPDMQEFAKITKRDPTGNWRTYFESVAKLLVTLPSAYTHAFCAYSLHGAQVTWLPEDYVAELDFFARAITLDPYIFDLLQVEIKKQQEHFASLARLRERVAAELG